jgi:hypothetical protein
MSLKKEDKEWFLDALKQQSQDLEALIDKLGKHVFRLETAFGLLARPSRAAIVDGAKKNHAKLLVSMFHASDLLALPFVEDGPGGLRSRQPVRCDSAAVQQLVDQLNDDFKVDLAKVGFRLIHTSRSSQRHRVKRGPRF